MGRSVALNVVRLMGETSGPQARDQLVDLRFKSVQVAVVVDEDVGGGVAGGVVKLLRDAGALASEALPTVMRRCIQVVQAGRPIEGSRERA